MNLGRSFIVALLVAITLSTFGLASSSDNHVIAEYQPLHEKKGIGKILDWTLAKVEKYYDSVMVADLFSAFVTKCDHILRIMVHSFKDMTLSYPVLYENEIQRLGQFDEEFKDLVNLRNKIDRKCLYSTNVDDRSVCIDKGVKINSKIQDLRSRRMKSTESIKWYKGMIEWCATYNNWFC